jgi:hypothetical protein
MTWLPYLPSVTVPTPSHNLHGFCWCQPIVETDPVTGDHLFIHRRSLDSQHIEEDKAMTEDTEPIVEAPDAPDDNPSEPADDPVPEPTEPVEEPKP